ncbi:hypothetical protein A2U01_0035505, partial [Trifolium medium]|nr:hypothetical protein [Trifolium medium]
HHHPSFPLLPNRPPPPPFNLATQPSSLQPAAPPFTPNPPRCSRALQWCDRFPLDSQRRQLTPTAEVRSAVVGFKGESSFLKTHVLRFCDLRSHYLQFHDLLF